MVVIANNFSVKADQTPDILPCNGYNRIIRLQYVQSTNNTLKSKLWTPECFKIARDCIFVLEK